MGIPNNYLYRYRTFQVIYFILFKVTSTSSSYLLHVHLPIYIRPGAIAVTVVD